MRDVSRNVFVPYEERDRCLPDAGWEACRASLAQISWYSTCNSLSTVKSVRILRGSTTWETHPRHTIKTLMSGSSPLFDIVIVFSGGDLREGNALFRRLYRSFPAPSRREDFKRDR